MKRKRTTFTTIVFEALTRADDFRTGRQLQAELKMDTNHVSACLYSLKKYNAVNCVEQPDALWWYATPKSDTRLFSVEEKSEELKPRKPRKPKVKS